MSDKPRRKPVTEDLFAGNQLPEYRKLLRAAILEETSLLMEKYQDEIIKKAKARVEGLLKAQSTRKS